MQVSVSTKDEGNEIDPFLAGYQAGRSAERERCAKVADGFPATLADQVEHNRAMPIARQIASLIRKE